MNRREFIGSTALGTAANTLAAQSGVSQGEARFVDR